jgi:hypothetical protein
MRPKALMALAAALVFGAAVAIAQDGDLNGVTMRVVDDLSGLEVTIIELDEDGAEASP